MSFREVRMKILYVFVAVVLGGALSFAQTGMGKIQGTIKDSSEAVVPGAKVIATHVATARQFITETNEVGFYLFPAMQNGQYMVSMEAPGMEPFKGEFLLQTGQTAVVDAVLKVGTTVTEVTVVADAAPLVTTTAPTLANITDRARIEQLPLNGRNIASLALVSTPGLFEGQDGAMNPILNGLRDSVELYQDGAVIKNRDTGNFSGRLPGLDSVEEIRVETSLSSAKSDRPGSIILSTRSGTNKVHGTLFETNRNSGVGVARRRQDYYTKPPHYVRNEFGGSVGGPVFLPKLYNGKNRTFFFTSYELNRIVSSSTTSTTMPTMAMRQGDFTGLIDSLGRQTIIYDPASTGAAPNWQRTAFPNNQIPLPRENPVATYIYSVMPTPTNDANPMLAGNYFGLGWDSTKDYMSTTRIDHRLSDRDLIFGRVTSTRNTKTYTSGVPSMDLAMNTVYNLHRDFNFAGNWSHTFSPNFLSEILVTFSRENKYTGAPPVEGISNMADFLNMPNPNSNPLVAFRPSNTGFGLNFGVQQMRQNFTNILVISQNFTRLQARHEIQFGAKVQQEYLQVMIDQPTSKPSYSSQFTALFDPASGSAYSAVPQTGHNVASFYIGGVSKYELTTKRPPYNLRDRAYSGYIQDNWKVTSSLTLNLGMRYANMPAMKDKDYFMTTFDKQAKKVVLGRTLEDMYKYNQTSPAAIAQFQNIGVQFETWSEADLPQALGYGHPWVFEPRIGFAYRIGKTQKPFVLRGGYGIYNYQVALRVWDNVAGSLVPFGYSIQYNQNDQSLAAVGIGDGLPNYALRSAIQYVAGVNSRKVLDNPDFVRISRGIGVQYTDPHLSPSTAHQWNFSVGREVFSHIVATASYLGTHAVNLPQFYNFNASPNDYVWYTTTGLPKPTGTYASVGMNPYDATTYGGVTAYQSTGYSNANSIQLELQRRYSGGYGFQFSYVLTNALTNSTKVANGGGPTIIPASSYLPSAVPEDFNDLNRFLYYIRDTAIPRNQLRWNWVIDLPFGRRKPLGRNAGRFLDGVIGGWQLAGLGSYRSTYWSLPTSNWGPVGNVEAYGTKYPIQNCSSGTCIPGYLYWNGYISPPLISRTDTAGNCTGICGVPADYASATIPLIPYGTTTLPANAPSNTNISKYWDTNDVWIELQNGTVVRTSYDTNLHPWVNANSLAGPWRFGLDASLFKSIAVTEGVRLRFNADFFSVLNNPGLGSPGSNGILSTQNSANSPRALQLCLRLTW